MARNSKLTYMKHLADQSKVYLNNIILYTSISSSVNLAIPSQFLARTTYSLKKRELYVLGSNGYIWFVINNQLNEENYL